MTGRFAPVVGCGTQQERPGWQQAAAAAALTSSAVGAGALLYFRHVRNLAGLPPALGLVPSWSPEGAQQMPDHSTAVWASESSSTRAGAATNTKTANSNGNSAGSKAPGVVTTLLAKPASTTKAAKGANHLPTPFAQTQQQAQQLGGADQLIRSLEVQHRMAEEAQQALSSAQTRLTALEAAHWELQQQLAERDAQLQSALTRLTDTTRALSEATSCAAEQQGGAAAALAAAKQQRLAEVQGLQAALVERDQQVQATLTRLVDTTKQLQAVQGKLHKAELLVRAVEEREGGKREAAVRELQGQLGERDQQLQLMLARLVEVNHQLTAAGETAKQQQEEAAARLQELSTRHAEEAASLRQRNHDLQEQLRVALQQLEGARHGSASSSPRAGGMVGPTSQQVVASHHLLLERDKQLQQALSKLVDTSQQLNAAQQELAGAKAAAQAAQAQVVAAKDAALAAAQQQVAERDGQLREALQQVMAATRALQAARSEAAAAHQLAAQRGAGEEAARAALLATQQQLAERDQQVASLLEQLVGCEAQVTQLQEGLAAAQKEAAAGSASAGAMAAKEAALAEAQAALIARSQQLTTTLGRLMTTSEALEAARQQLTAREATPAAPSSSSSSAAEGEMRCAAAMNSPRADMGNASRQGVGLIRSASLQQGLLAPAGMNALTPMPPQPAAKEPRPASVAASAVGMARPTLLRTGSLASSPCGPVGPLTGALMANYGNANTPAGSKQVEQQPAPGGAGDVAKRLIRSGSLQQLEPGLVRHHA